MTQMYTLSEIEQIAFNGFGYDMNQTVLDIINDLAMKVGSPAYIKTPVFQKKEQSKQSQQPVRKRRTKELSNTEWEKQEQPNHTSSVLVQKQGIDAEINKIRVCLNKLSESTYADNVIQIKDIINAMNVCEEDLHKVGNAIFEIASNNKFFSKLYANLYTELMQTFPMLIEIFTKNYNSYSALFKNIQYVNPDVDYNQFCVNNVANEQRKAMSAFFVNLNLSGVIPAENIAIILKELFESVLSLMVQPNKSNEVCEIVENIAILYTTKELPETKVAWINEEHTLPELILKLGQTKMKTYPSLPSKAIFKFMDL
jgi:hypothetical protein